MRYDVVIIGGGLSGLTCGIRLQEAGKNCAIISAGQSALHFSSGAFDFLNKLPDGTRVMHPLDAIKRLGGNHPYQKIGEEKIREYVADVQDWFGKSGIVLHGDVEKNHYCLSPIGIIKSAWLSFDDFEPLETADAFPYKRVAVANFAGFIDFYPRFIADALAEKRFIPKYTASAPCRIAVRKCSFPPAGAKTSVICASGYLLYIIRTEREDRAAAAQGSRPLYAPRRNLACHAPRTFSKTSPRATILPTRRHP